MGGQGPRCLRNVVLGGAGLWSQPSPRLPGKGCFRRPPPISSPVPVLPWAWPESALPARARPCLEGPSAPGPPRLCQATAAGSLVHARTRSAGRSLGSCYTTGMVLPLRRLLARRTVWRDKLGHEQSTGAWEEDSVCTWGAGCTSSTVNLSGPPAPEPPSWAQGHWR